VIYLPSKSKKRSRKKISSGTKNNLDTIISEISIITGRKNLPKDDRMLMLNGVNRAPGQPSLK